MTEKIILVTGSSGLIGRALCHRLGSSGDQVIGLDMEGPPYPPPRTDCIFVDLTSDESLQTAMFIVEERYGKCLDAVIHLAAYYNFSGKPSRLYDTLTYQGTKRLFNELKRFEVGQFIFSSTMLVHAPARSGETINENSPLLGTWAYPQSKIKTEKLIEQIHKGIPAVMLRIAGVYTDVCECVPIAHQIQRIYEKSVTSHFYPGDMNAAQAFVHLDDLVDAFILVLDQRDKLAYYDVFLIGEEDAMSYDQLQQDISQHLFGCDWVTEPVPPPLAKAGAWTQDIIPVVGKHAFIKPWMIDRASDNYVLDTTKARQQLAWQPRRSLRATLPSMIEGLKVDPERWYRLNHLHPTGHLKHKKAA
jgi:nucleoside-diphosphate-sugar epimerase